MYRRKQVEEMTGIPARRIQFYTDQGLLPEVEKATGRGIERQYSKDDVFRLAIVKEMADLGLSLFTIKGFLDRTAIDHELYGRITFKSFSHGQRLIFMYERHSDGFQIFVVSATYESLIDRLKKQFLIDKDRRNSVTSQVIIHLGNIFDRINWV